MAAATTTATNSLLIQIPSGRQKTLPNNKFHLLRHHDHNCSYFSKTLFPRRPALPSPIHFLPNKHHQKNKYEKKKATTVASGSSGLYSSHQFQLTRENVDLVLEDVRPYLIADGGNVDIVSVENGVVYLQLQGACGSCPSSTTTMKMGIERVLKEKFGDAIKEICQVYDEQINEINVETVNGHLDILRPAIKNYGGNVEVLSVEGRDCVVKYVGPESIGSGIKAAIKEKFPDIINVIFTD